MSSASDTAGAAKLPILRTIEEGLAALRPALGGFALLLLLLLAIEIAAGVVAASLSGDPWDFVLARKRSGPTSAVSVGVGLAHLLILIVVYANLQFAATRLVLFAERPAVVDLLLWTNRHWRLAGNALLLGLVAGVPLLVGALMTPYLGPLLATPIAVMAVQAIYGLCWLWASGWILLLPSIIADDRSGHALDVAWMISGGHRLRLMGLAICGVAASLLITGAGMIASSLFNTELLGFQIAGHLLETLARGSVWIVFAASAAVAYRRLTGMGAKAA
jgi:hypothetical protein